MRTENKDKELNHRHFIGLRLTDVELDLLGQGAACLSISRSEYLRKLLLEKQINHQIEVVADMNDLRKLVSEYGKIGSNLNQIAKHFNSGGSQSRAIENEIHQCITDLFLLRKEVLKLTGGMNGNMYEFCTLFYNFVTASRHSVRAYSYALPPQFRSSYLSTSARLSAV
jgi:Bacterial mobilisation protein (MobC).